MTSIIDNLLDLKSEWCENIKGKGKKRKNTLKTKIIPFKPKTPFTEAIRKDLHSSLHLMKMTNSNQ